MIAKATTQDHTLVELCIAYLADLERRGKSLMTRASYDSDLKIAQEVLGGTTSLSALTPKKVQGFYDSEKVTKTKSGKPKAEPTILKTRRVLRMALVWAKEEGWIETAPVPDLKEPKAKAEKPAKGKAAKAKPAAKPKGKAKGKKRKSTKASVAVRESA